MLLEDRRGPVGLHVRVCEYACRRTRVILSHSTNRGEYLEDFRPGRRSRNLRPASSGMTCSALELTSICEAVPRVNFPPSPSARNPSNRAARLEGEREERVGRPDRGDPGGPSLSRKWHLYERVAVLVGPGVLLDQRRKKLGLLAIDQVGKSDHRCGRCCCRVRHAPTPLSAFAVMRWSRHPRHYLFIVAKPVQG